MRKFVLTAESFTGSVLFGFNDGGTLVLFENTAELEDVKLAWFPRNLPTSIDHMKELFLPPKFKLTEMTEDLSFDAFWSKYDKKRNRIRCEPLWKRMRDVDKLKCIKSIEPYNNYLRRFSWRIKLDPENYLKRKEYENNWNQLTS